MWRRVAKVLKLHHAVKLIDEREERRAQLRAARATLAAQTRAVHAMEAQSRVGSYARIRIGR
jgi:hypothetical protein